MTISKQKVHLFLRLSIALAIIGILFKLMHWPYPWFFLVGGILGIVIFYSLRFYLKQPKVLLDYSKLFLVISFFIHYVFRVFHLGYGYIFTRITQIALLLFIILHMRQVLFLENYDDENPESTSPRSTIRKGLSYVLYGTAAIGILLGAQFKILHWQFGMFNGNVLLTIGLLAAATAVVIRLKDNEA